VERAVPRGGEAFVGGANGGEEGAGIRPLCLVCFQGKWYASSGTRVWVKLSSIRMVVVQNDRNLSQGATGSLDGEVWRVALHRRISPV